MRRILLALALSLGLSGSALAADCWGNATGAQANCGAVQMFLNPSAQSVPVTAAAPLPVTIISGGSGGGAMTVADGADVAEGATTDAAATQGGTGTLSAKLRLLTTQFNTLNTTVGLAANQTAVQAPVAPATATATKSILFGAQATTAAVNPTTGQQSALSSDTNNNLLVSAGGAPNLAIAQVSVATSDTAVVAARALRRSVTIQQITGTQNVFCNQTTATAGNGVVLPAVVGASVTFNTTSAIRCIAITGAQTVAVAETY